MADPAQTWTIEPTIARARDDHTPNFPPGTDAVHSDTNFQPLGLNNTWLVGRAQPQEEPVFSPADV